MALTKISGDVIKDGINVSGILTATKFIGDLTGNINSTGVSTFSGGIQGNVTGNITGNVAGNVIGNVNSTGVSTFSTLTATSIVGVVTAGITTIHARSLVGVSTAGIATAYISSVNDGPLAGSRNRIINGDCRIDQRAAVVTTSGSYFTDRWRVDATTTGAFQCAQSGAAPTGFTNSLLFDVTTADTSIAAGEFAIVGQIIEGLNTSDLSWGSASAQTVTLSFWVNSTTTGTYCVSLRNSAVNRSYIAEYSISSANTWERKAITIPGDTSGTWLVTNGLGIVVAFALATGSTYQTTAGSWQVGNLLSTSAQTNLMASTSNEIRITGVQLESGTVATPFERRSYGQELALCQRYYEVGHIAAVSSAGSGTAIQRSPLFYKVNKRTTPTFIFAYVVGTSQTPSLNGAYETFAWLAWPSFSSSSQETINTYAASAEL